MKNLNKDQIKVVATTMSKLKIIACATAFNFILVGCGGSSSGGTEMEQISGLGPFDSGIGSGEYQPEPERLNSVASDSSELYATQSFSFDSSSTTRVRVSAEDVTQLPIIGATVRVFGMKDEFADWQDIGDTDRQLLLVGQTNNLGFLEKSLEVSPLIKQLLLTIDAVGIENKVIVMVSDVIAHHFQGNSE